MILRNLVRRALCLLLESLDNNDEPAITAEEDRRVAELLTGLTTEEDLDVAKILTGLAAEKEDQKVAEVLTGLLATTSTADITPDIIEFMLIPLMKRVNAMWVELEMDFRDRLHVADDQDQTLCGSARGKLVDTPEEADCPDCLSITEHSLTCSPKPPNVQFTAVPHPFAWTMIESRHPSPMNYPQVGVLYHEWSRCECPSCHVFLNALTSWGDSTMPNELPLVGICSACGTPFRLTPEHTMEALSPEEIDGLAPELIQTMQQVQAMLNQ
jgi:hypothetical protein